MSVVSIVICHAASDPVRPGYKAGVQCKICDAPLMVASKGRAMIAEGAHPMCNDCGFGIATRAAELGIHLGVGASPEACAQLAAAMEEMARAVANASNN